MATTAEMIESSAQAPCTCGACEECYERYFAMADEFDALMTAIQAQRHALRCATDRDEPFYCENDLDKGWDRAAALARVLVRHAEALRDFYKC